MATNRQNEQIVGQISGTLLSCAQRLTPLRAYSEADAAAALTNSSSQLHLAIDRLMADVKTLCIDAISRRTKVLHDQANSLFGDNLSQVKPWIDKREDVLVKCHEMSRQLNKEASNMDAHSLMKMKSDCENYSKETENLERASPFRKLTLDDSEASAVSQKLVDLIMRIGSFQDNFPSADDSLSSDCISVGSVSTASLFNGNTYSAKSKPLKTFGDRKSGGPELEKFNSPRGCVAFPSTDLMAIADSYNNRVKVMNINTGDVVQNLVFNIERNKTLSSKQLTFNGLAVDKNQGLLYMSDADRGSVCLVDVSSILKTGGITGEANQLTNWPIIAQLGSHGFQSKQFNIPTGVAVDISSDIICICDTMNHQIKLWSLRSRELICHFGELGQKGGQFLEPSYCAIADSQELVSDTTTRLRLAVSDSGNNRVQLFQIEKIITDPASIKASISPIAAFGKEGSKLGCLWNPRGIAFDPNGNIVVADAGNKRIQVFKKDGTPICSFASGCGVIPESVALINATGNIVVTDRKQNLVHIF